MRLSRAAVAGGVLLIGSVGVAGCLNGEPVSPQADLSGLVGSMRPVGPVETGWRVRKVVDGDTIRVVRNGQELKVRLIGIDSPESVKPNSPIECYGPQASGFAQDRLAGATVALEGDPSQQPTDRYGRTLAYVWIVDDDGQPESLFNLEAIAVGAASEATYDGRYQWQQAFRAAQARAREQGAGLWSACDAS